MHASTAAEILELWERAQGRPPVARDLDIAESASPGTPRTELAELSPGQRDRLLLGFREWTFGEGLAGLIVCPACGAELEVACNAADLWAASGEEAAPELSVSVQGYEVRFRVPNSCDLEAATGAESLDAARRLLLHQCVLESRRSAEPVSAAELPENVVAAIEERMAEVDPQAVVWLPVACDGCGHQWPVAFDVGSFLWEEVAALARRTLRDVHDLASAYGWSEADILAMSPDRRRAYLTLAGG